MEITKCNYKVLKYNAEVFYNLFERRNYKQMKTLIEEICTGVTGKLGLDAYIQGFRRLIPEFGFFIDALVSRKPQKSIMVKQMTVAFHSMVRVSFENNWNSHFDSIGAAESLAIAELMTQYIDLLTKFSIADAYLKDWTRPVLQTFLKHLFENSKEIFENLLTDLRSSSYTLNGKTYSRFPDNLESHLNFIAEHYRKAPSAVFLEELASFVGSFLNCFIFNVLQILKTEDSSFDFYTMLLNTNCIRIAKGLQKKLSDFTKGQIPIPKIKEYMNDDLFFYLLRRLNRLVVVKLREKSDCVAASLFQTESIVFDMPFKDLIGGIVLVFANHFSKIADPVIAEEMTDFVLQKIAEKYILLYTSQTAKIARRDFSDLAARIESHFKIYTEACKPEVTPNSDEVCRLFKVFRDFVVCKDMDKIIVAIVNIQAYIPILKEESNLRGLISSKTGIPQNSHKFLVDYFIVPGKTINCFIDKHRKKASLRRVFTTSVLIIIFMVKISIIIRSALLEKEKFENS